MNRTKVSTEAPDWFHVVNDNKIKKWNQKFIDNDDPLSVFSRYQKWITVTPRNKNRRKPLEKIKISKMEETSKVMPKWMQITGKDKKLEDTMKASEYTSMRDVNIKLVITYRVKGGSFLSIKIQTIQKKIEKITNQYSLLVIIDII